MNAIQKFFARIALKRLKDALDKLDNKTVMTIAVKLNSKVDIPALTEATEYKIIYNTLSSAIDAARELLDIVKV
jgi:hypothetical protein